MTKMTKVDYYAVMNFCTDNKINSGHGKDLHPSIIRSFVKYPYNSHSEYNNKLNSFEGEHRTERLVKYILDNNLKVQR